MLAGCTIHHPIIERPFGFKTQYQEGSPLTNLKQTGEIEIVFPRNEFGPANSGFNWSANLEPKDEYTISYEVKFSDGFDFSKGGKLPGLCGGQGKAGIRPVGDNKMSARIMWRQDGKIVSYVYHLDQKGNYGEDFVWTKEFGNPLHFRVNQWEKIKFTVKLNSMKKEDGSIIGYINGIPAIRVLNLRFRITEHLKIDHLCFNTFYGGSDQTWAPRNEQRLFIRGLKIN